MSFARARFAFAFALTLAAPLAGCRPPPPAAVGETTAVGRGQLYRTGQPAYDRYFEAVHQLQADVARAPAERRAARAELAHALGLLSDAPPGRLAEALHERALDAGKGGHWFRVEGYRAVTEGAAPEPPVRSVGQALDACLRSEAAASDKLRQVPGRVRSLWDLTGWVESRLDADFFGFKRKEVRREVAAVRRSLRALSDETTGRLLEGEKFVLDLTAAVSPPAVGVAASAPSAPEAERADRKRGHAGARKPAHAAERAAAPARAEGEPAPAAKPVAEARPAAAPAVKPAAARPAPKPAGKPAGDDFNP